MTADNKAFGPYSLIRRAGEMYFTAGHIGVNTATKEVAEDAATQTTKTLDNLAVTLDSVGLTLDDVVKTTIYLTDLGDFQSVNEAYEKRFTKPCPARSTVAVKELPRVAISGPVKVEIEAIAIKKETT
jgi:2-iminobutanoate/2-iminopropanoate deaminase